MLLLSLTIFFNPWIYLFLILCFSSLFLSFFGILLIDIVNAKVSLRQSGILGLASIIRAYPHEIKSFTPEILCIVAGHINDPSPIPLAVRRVLSDFWKTHRDMWTVHKREFTESQLDELSELMLAPYYYC